MYKSLSLACLMLTLTAATTATQAAQLPSPALKLCAETINQQVMKRYGKDARLNNIQAQEMPGTRPFIHISAKSGVIGVPRPMQISFYCTYRSDNRTLTQAYINNPPPSPVPPPRPPQPQVPNMEQACVNSIAQKIQPQYGNRAQLQYYPLTVMNGPQGMTHYEGKGRVFNTRSPQQNGDTITFSCNAQNNRIIKSDYFNVPKPSQPMN